jgi:hypothetical protein
MIRKLTLLAALTALALPLTAYGIASAQQNANPQAPQGHRTVPQGQMMGPEMQGNMTNMMKMMDQMTEMMETCNTMMKAAMQKNGQGGQAETRPEQKG